MKNPSVILFLMYIVIPLCASENSQEFERVKIRLEMLYEERNKTKEAEKMFLLSQQKHQQWYLEKGRKWRIKKTVDGVNFVDRDSSPIKEIKIINHNHKDCGDVCIS